MAKATAAIYLGINQVEGRAIDNFDDAPSGREEIEFESKGRSVAGHCFS